MAKLVNNRELNREISIAAGRGPHALLALVKSRVAEFNSVNAATALHRLSQSHERSQWTAQLQLHDDEVFQALLGHTVGLLALPPGPDCDARATSTIAHSLAALGCRDEGAALAVTEAARKRLGSFDRQGHVNLMWALAKLPRVKGTKVIGRKLALASKPLVGEFSPQELSNLVWSLGKLSVRDNQLMSMISDAVRKCLDNFTGQGLATVAASYARIGVFVELLMMEIGEAARERMSRLNGRDTAQILWAFAKFKLRDEELFEDLCKHTGRLDLSCQGKDLVVMFIWSFGTLGWVPGSGGLVQGLLQRAAELAPELGARRMVRLLTATAKLRGKVEASGGASGRPGVKVDAGTEEALTSLAAVLTENLASISDQMSAQEVGISAWAIATIRPRGWKKVLRSLLGQAQGALEELNWWSINIHNQSKIMLILQLINMNSIHINIDDY